MKPGVVTIEAQRLWIRTTYKHNPSLGAVAHQFAGLGRFDVGGAKRLQPSFWTSDVLYVACSEVASLSEKISTFQDCQSASYMEDVANGQSFASIPAGGVVPAHFVKINKVVGISLSRDYPFIDIEAPETISYLNGVPYLLEKAHRLGYDVIDRCLIISDERIFTQALALHFYTQTNVAGRPLYYGIYYSSRFGSHWTCLAIFASRVDLTEVYNHALTRKRCSFVKALQYMNMTVEEAYDDAVIQSSFLMLLPTPLENKRASKQTRRKLAKG